MRVREAVLTDIEQIAEQEREIFTDYWSESSLRESFRQPHVLMLVVATELEDKEAEEICAYLILYVSGDEMEIANLAVSPKHRRKGLANMLLEEGFQRTRRVGVRRVFLEVREGNDAARALYRGLGFVEIGMRKNYYDQPVEHAIIMEKKLDISTSI